MQKMPVFNALLRPHLQNLAPYSSARDEYTGKVGVFLDANENPLGSVTEQEFNRYPDPYQIAIKEKLAPIKGVHTSQIFLGNGSDEPIDLLIRAFCEPKQDSILLLPPTYGMYEVSANINNVSIIKIPLTADFKINKTTVLNEIETNTALKIIWICSPNNPSGNLVQREVVLEILEKFKGLVVVDEAYIDFCPEATFLPQLQQYPNLIILQTFSKAWGMASLRLGMAFAHPEIVKILNRIKPPYNINGLTQRILCDALDASDKKNGFVKQLIENKKWLENILQALPIVEHIYPSDANFLLVKISNAKAVFDYLIAHTTIVRDRSKVQNCEGCLRISIGTMTENKQLIALLQKFEL